MALQNIESAIKCMLPIEKQWNDYMQSIGKQYDNMRRVIFNSEKEIFNKIKNILNKEKYIAEALKPSSVKKIISTFFSEELSPGYSCTIRWMCSKIRQN